MTAKLDNETPGLTSMALWRLAAKTMEPDLVDEWLLGERATFLRLMAQLWYDNRDEIERIAAKCGGLAVSFSIKSDRSFEVPVVKITGSFSETHPMKAESEVPDANQNELPFERNHEN